MKLQKLGIILLMLIWLTTTGVQAQSPTPRLKDKVKEIRQDIKDEIKEKREDIKEEFREMKASVSAALKQLRSGRIALGSGEITAINGMTLTVVHEGKTYTVLTDDKTQFRRKFWGKSELAEFGIGDKINGVGTWVDEEHTTIKARFIRNLSIQMRHGVFFGTVTEISATGFKMDSERRGEQTVTVGADTKYVNRREETITLGDIAVGQRVRVRGLWNSRTSTITEVTKVKNYSLPPRASISPRVIP